MLFIVRIVDKAGSQAIRERFLPDHLEWLDQYQSVVLVAGSLRSEPEANPSGACWVVEAQDRPQVEALLQSDPFWREGLRETYEILHWSKAFPERKIPV